MQESYGEGVASRTGPESCAGARKGMGEALTGVPAGRVLSREIPHFRVPTPSMERGRQHRGHRQREMLGDPARSKTPSMLGSSTRRNWEIPSLAPAKGAGVRAVNPHGARRR